MRRALTTTALVAVAALGLAACGSDTATDAASSAKSAATAASSQAAGAASSAAGAASAAASSAAAGASQAVAGKDVVASLVGLNGVTMTPAALQMAGLDKVLAGKGPYTLFAPTDAAFSKVPKAEIDAAMANPEKALKPTLSYHVVSGKLTIKDLTAKNGQKLTTMAGVPLTVKVAGGKVSLVDATGVTVNVAQSDVNASNGVVHTIDGVLTPSK